MCASERVCLCAASAECADIVRASATYLAVANASDYFARFIFIFFFFSVSISMQFRSHSAARALAVCRHDGAANAMRSRVGLSVCVRVRPENERMQRTNECHRSGRCTSIENINLTI